MKFHIKDKIISLNIILLILLTFVKTSMCPHLEVGLDLLHGGQRVVPEQGVHAHHDARGAEAALGSVTVGHPLLDSVKSGLGVTDALHSGHGQS